MPTTRRAAVLAATALTVTAAGALATEAAARQPSEAASVPAARAKAFSVTASLKDESVLRNEKVVLSGVVEPARTARNVLIQEKSGDGWTTITKRTMNDNGKYRYAFKRQEAGAVTLRARMPKVGRVAAGTSPEVELTVAEQALVKFRIAPGTGSDDWNTVETMVQAVTGDTLRLVNKDSVPHQVHTEGTPFAHPSKTIAPGGRADFVLAEPYDASTLGPLYCHTHGHHATFWLNVD